MANNVDEEFWVRAVPDHDVIRSESNIIGLHIEADTMDQFHEAVLYVAPELIIANHLGGSAVAGRHEEDFLVSPPWPGTRDLDERAPEGFRAGQAAVSTYRERYPQGRGSGSKTVTSGCRRPTTPRPTRSAGRRCRHSGQGRHAHPIGSPYPDSSRTLLRRWSTAEVSSKA